MRLDHLLSKEHHEKGEASGLARAVRSPVVCSGRGFGAQQQWSFQTGRIAGTLLGPEATPQVVATVVVMVVVSLHLGGGVWCLVIG